MGQGEIVEYLRGCKEPKTSRQISEAVGIAKSTTDHNLKRLRDTDKRIKWIDVNSKKHKYHRVLKKYYISE